MKKIVSLFAALALFLPSFTWAASKDGWILTQKNDLTDGESKLYISPTGVKSEARGYTAILRLSDSKVLILNDEKKEYSESTFEEWKKNIQKLRRITDMMGSDESTEEAGSEKVAGLEAKKFIIHSKGGELSIPGLDLKSFGLGDDLTMPDSTHEIWVTKEIPLAPQLAEFLKTTMGQEGRLPETADGLVVRLVSTEKDEKPVTVINTLKYEKMPIEDSTFDTPTGYKKLDGFMGLPVTMNELVSPQENEEEDDSTEE